MISLGWLPREPPLEVSGVACLGTVAQLMLRRLARCDDGALDVLHGVASPGLLLLLGPTEALPWVDGALWLGRDPLAPSLLLPTALRPSVPSDWFERRLRQVAPSGRLAVLPQTGQLVPLTAARPVSRQVLARLAS